MVNIWKIYSGLVNLSSGGPHSEDEKEKLVAAVLLQPAYQALQLAKDMKK